MVKREWQPVEALRRRCCYSALIRDAAVFACPSGNVALLSIDPSGCRDYETAEIRGALRMAVSDAFRSLPAGQQITSYVATTSSLPRGRDGDTDYAKAWEIYHGRTIRLGTAEWRRSGPSIGASPDAIVRAALLWLQARFPSHSLNSGMSPNLDMEIDSLAWLQLALEMEQALAVTFDEATMQTPLTIGEFLQRLESFPSDAMQKRQSTGLGELKPSLRQLNWLVRRGALHRFANAALHAVIRGTMRSLFRFRVSGLNNLPPTGPFVLCANHLSDLDALVLPSAIPFSLVGRLHFAAAATRLFASPLTRALCSTAQVYPIDDRNPGPALALALEVLKRGDVQTWFPEMWRSADGMPQPFLRGIGVLAKEANVPIVPVAIQGTFELMPRWRRFPALGRINVTVGPALYPDQLNAAGPGNDAYSRITNAIAAAHSKLIAEAV